MGRIHRLSDELSNQIAAGEVVERPASVVKELVENAIDAGATRIRVEIDHGGIARILVSDDGEGMDGDDAPLALQRHATSKIAHIDDLTRIRSFGFRGEALPSIASVARLTLRTRREESGEGVEVVCGGGASLTAKPASSARGTTVEVRDLFYNVPARKKFLKATATESAHVGEVLLFAALSRPEITFQLFRDGRLSREYLKRSSRRERAEEATSAETLVDAGATSGDFKIEAFLSPPERARIGAGGLHILVNGRPVRDRQLARAVAQAYGSILPPGHFPVGVVYIDLPAEQVDVNVHPQKAEVRFRDARVLFDLITRELHATLSKAFDSVAELSPRDLHRPRWITPSSYKAPELTRVVAPEPTLFSPPPSPAITAPTEDPFGGVPFYSSLQFIRQIRGTFLLCEGADGIYVIDQHAAAERVTFDRLRKTMKQSALAAQTLLSPVVVELSHKEVAAIGEREADLEACGMSVRMLSSTSVAVVAVPELISDRSPEDLLRALAAEWTQAATRPFSQWIDHTLATMACHGSLRAGDAIADEEAAALLQALGEVDFASHCPHGRPILTRLGFDEMERRVGR